jgi:hypothetical protein
VTPRGKCRYQAVNLGAVARGGETLYLSATVHDGELGVHFLNLPKKRPTCENLSKKKRKKAKKNKKKKSPCLAAAGAPLPPPLLLPRLFPIIYGDLAIKYPNQWPTLAGTQPSPVVARPS